MNSHDQRGVMLKWSKRGVAAAVAGALLLSAPAAIRSGSAPASVPASSSVSTSTMITGTQGTSQGSLLASSSVAPVSMQNAIANDAQKRISIRPIIDWIKRVVPWLWNSLVNAVKWGWSALVNWWNGLAGWIRNTLNWFIGGALWDFYLELRRWIFGW